MTGSRRAKNGALSPLRTVPRPLLDCPPPLAKPRVPPRATSRADRAFGRPELGLKSFRSTFRAANKFARPATRSARTFRDGLQERFRVGRHRPEPGQSMSAGPTPSVAKTVRGSSFLIGVSQYSPPCFTIAQNLFLLITATFTPWTPSEITFSFSFACISRWAGRFLGCGVEMFRSVENTMGKVLQ